VRLAQDRVMHYLLIDFHGNLGNQAGDGPASSRYTEPRLSKLIEEGMLQGLKKNNVDFIPNYGVAMACSWAPNNLSEVATSINQYLAGEEPILMGPDFPSGGIIINSKGILMIMKTGHGSVKIRSKYEIDKQKLYL